jgi:hypothetical protein
MAFYKIASADLTNTPLLRHVARFGKPMIVSTGGATLEDVDRAVNTVLPINSQLCVMQCTAAYPADYAELDLGVIQTFRERYPEVTIGYSGHDNSISMPVVAYMLGARVIEKHFTLNRVMKGTDHIFSLEPAGMRRVVRDLERARLAVGDGVKKRRPSEFAPMVKMAKSLYTARPLRAGHVLTEADLSIKCPAAGCPPTRWTMSSVGRCWWTWRKRTRWRSSTSAQPTPGSSPERTPADAKTSPTPQPLRGVTILRLASPCGARISLCGATSLRTCADILPHAWGRQARTGGGLEDHW